MRPASFSMVLSLALVACGGAQPASPRTTATNEGAVPPEGWQRTSIEEAGLSLSLPSEASRRVVERDDGATIQYIAVRDALAVVVSVEFLGAVITSAEEPAALDRVAAMFVERAADADRACASAPIESFVHAEHAGRAVISSGCRALRDGSMAAMVWMHGSAIVSTIVAGENVPSEVTEETLRGVLASVQFGEPRSWLAGEPTRISPPNASGLSFAMPGGPEVQTGESEGSSFAHYLLEPIAGIGVRVNVTAPAALPLERYCAALVENPSFVDAARTDAVHAPLELPYCEVRARQRSHPATAELHDVFVVPGAVLEMIWVGPSEPSFVASGERALESMRSSITRE